MSYYRSPDIVAPNYDHRIVLRELRCWALEESAARQHFIFNLCLLLGCRITDDFQELLALLSSGASALKLLNDKRMGSLYQSALAHWAKEFGINGPIPQSAGSSD